MARPRQIRRAPQGSPPAGALVRGAVEHHGRFAFVLADDPAKQDLMLRGPSLRLAMNGDTVEAKVAPGRSDRPSGEIVRVLQRARRTVVGVLERREGAWRATPEEEAEAVPIQILGFEGGLKPAPGLVAVVRVTRWPTLREPAAGTVVELLGRPGEPRVRLEAVLRTRELATGFPPAALAECRGLPRTVLPRAWSGRRVLFDTPVFTIDGADAKDFDDAVSLEPLGGGRALLGVHIADVSHYVRPGGALDAEARARATSVYLPDRVVPMLPPALSDDLCSLRPDVERLTLSCLLEVDGSGRVLDARFAESVIRSWRRFTYEEAEAVLAGRGVPGVPARVAETLRRMGPLARAMTRSRMRRGALDFSLPEHKVVVDADGSPVRVEKRPRLGSHRLIEEFMLAANEATARELKSAGVPLLHRIHEAPDPKRLIELGRELEKLGVAAPARLADDPARALQELLRRAQGHPLEETINFLTVRSLRQAVYSEKGAIHFGLASRAYTHFTSPIRRYPDLFNHRAIREALRRKGRRAPSRGREGGASPQAERLALRQLAAHCSERERVAAEAERQGVDILRAELLRRRVGQVLEALVARNTPAGMLVALPDSGAIGMVRGETGRLGDRVKVRLDSVHEGRGELEFSLATGKTQRMRS